MKVLWLGAGASRSVGYPVTASLLDALDRWVRAGTDVLTHAAWERFNDYRDSAQGVEKTVLQSPNPEVALTLPDLLAAALKADDESIDAFVKSTIVVLRDRRRRGEDEQTFIETAKNNVEERYAASARLPLEEARKARQSFEIVLDDYLAHRHWLDGQASNIDRRECLRRELAWLDQSDVVITTSWDTSVERTLLEQGRWTPGDGYGFSVDLSDGWRAELGETTNLPQWVPRQSQIQVLKLHGSFGWRWNTRFGRAVTAQGQVFLEFNRFLSELPFRSGEEMVVARDRRAPDEFDGADMPLFVLPSYLKQLEGETMQLVWHKASKALSSAEQIRFVGASLPPSDVAVRAILNSVRFRSEDGAVRVAVHNPDRATHDRWRDFLGAKVSVLPLAQVNGMVTPPAREALERHAVRIRRCARAARASVLARLSAADCAAFVEVSGKRHVHACGKRR